MTKKQTGYTVTRKSFVPCNFNDIGSMQKAVDYIISLEREDGEKIPEPEGTVHEDMHYKKSTRDAK